MSRLLRSLANNSLTLLTLGRTQQEVKRLFIGCNNTKLHTSVIYKGIRKVHFLSGCGHKLLMLDVAYQKEMFGQTQIN